MIIVNADDFGMSGEVTAAIDQCMNEGIISSTTIMANMPAFDMAVGLALKNGYQNNIGIHFNLTQGKPLSDSILSCLRMCDKGMNFIYKRNFIFFSFAERKAIREELRAQIEKIRGAGIPISHFDSHHHIHTEFFLFLAIRNVLKEYGIRRVRISSNLENGKNVISCVMKKVYKYMYNAFLRIQGFKTVQYMGDYNPMIDCIMAYNNYTVELMCHPIEMNGVLMDNFNKRPLKRHSLQLQSYMNL